MNQPNKDNTKLPPMKEDKNIKWVNVYSDNDIPDKHDRWQRRAIVRYGSFGGLQIGYVTRILETFSYNKKVLKMPSAKTLYIPHFFVQDFKGGRKVFYKKEDQAKKAIEIDFYLFRDYIKTIGLKTKEKYCNMCEKMTKHRTINVCQKCEKNL